MTKDEIFNKIYKQAAVDWKKNRRVYINRMLTRHPFIDVLIKSGKLRPRPTEKEMTS